VGGGGSEALQMSLTTHLKIQKSFFLPFSKRFGFVESCVGEEII
jgi:hypothetical protein